MVIANFQIGGCLGSRLANTLSVYQGSGGRFFVNKGNKFSTNIKAAMAVKECGLLSNTDVSPNISPLWRSAMNVSGVHATRLL